MREAKIHCLLALTFLGVPLPTSGEQAADALHGWQQGFRVECQLPAWHAHGLITHNRCLACPCHASADEYLRCQEERRWWPQDGLLAHLPSAVLRCTAGAACSCSSGGSSGGSSSGDPVQRRVAELESGACVWMARPDAFIGSGRAASGGNPSAAGSITKARRDSDAAAAKAAAPANGGTLRWHSSREGLSGEPSLPAGASSGLRSSGAGWPLPGWISSGLSSKLPGRGSSGPGSLAQPAADAAPTAAAPQWQRPPVTVVRLHGGSLGDPSPLLHPSPFASFPAAASASAAAPPGVAVTAAAPAAVAASGSPVAGAHGSGVGSSSLPAAASMREQQEPNPPEAGSSGVYRHWQAAGLQAAAAGGQQQAPTPPEQQQRQSAGSQAAMSSGQPPLPLSLPVLSSIEPQSVLPADSERLPVDHGQHQDQQLLAQQRQQLLQTQMVAFGLAGAPPPLDSMRVCPCCALHHTASLFYASRLPPRFLQHPAVLLLPMLMQVPTSGTAQLPRRKQRSCWTCCARCCWRKSRSCWTSQACASCAGPAGTCRWGGPAAVAAAVAVAGGRAWRVLAQWALARPLFLADHCS